MTHTTYTKNFEQIFSIRGEDILVTSLARFDVESGEMIYDQELDDAAIEAAYDLYRKNNDYLSSKLIKEIRMKIGISQRDFATLMGWSQTTIVMYESGSLPTTNNNTQLKMIYENSCELNQYYNNAKNLLSPKACEKIDSYLLGLKSVDVDNEFSALDIVDWFIVDNIKQMEMSEIVEHLTQLKVMKLLYYAQGIMMTRFKQKLFGDEILAWDYGPVIRAVYDKYQGKRSIVIDFVGDKIPQQLIENYEKINKNRKVFEVLDLVQKNLGHLSGISLMHKTHSERPWIETSKNKVINDELIKQYFERNIFDVLSVNANGDI